MKKLRALGARYLPQPLKRLLWKAYHTVYFLRYRREPRYPHLPGPKNDLPRIVIACNEYGAYCIPRSSYHRRTSQTILDGRVYEAETIRFMLSHCANGDIVQAGACFGDFLPALSHGCAAGAHIWSFEPGAENYRCALVTIALNDLKNVTLRHTGLGSETGTGRLVIRDRHGIPLGAASQVEWANAVLNPDQSEPIELVSIDQSVPEPRNVSIMQLDVEEYEQQALQGAMKTIARCKPIIILETLPTPAWLEENLFPLGYEISKQKLGRNAILTPPT